MSPSPRLLLALALVLPAPFAAVPMLVDAAPTLGAGAPFDDAGTGRGLALVDVVGPDPSAPGDPAKVGPPDGILDVASTWIVPPIGTVHHDCRV